MVNGCRGGACLVGHVLPERRRARGGSSGGVARVSSARGILDCEEEVVVGGQGGKGCFWTASFDRTVINLYNRY